MSERSGLDRLDSSSARPIDKSTWGDGPWQTEPDRLEWTHAGLPCLAARSESGGNWCGYVAVPPGHPLHGRDYDHADVDVEVHGGGLTYANRCEGHVCHVPRPGEPDDVWWFGFDCAHFGDLSPARHARDVGRGYPFPEKPYDHAKAIARNDWGVEVYRTLDYVQAETNRLADQFADRERLDRH
jgi:hypothetical protein